MIKGIGKSVIMVFILCCSLSITGQVQSDSLKRLPVEHVGNVIIKTNLISMLSGTFIPLTSEYKLLCEFKTIGRHSFQIEISYLNKSPFTKSFEWLGEIRNPGLFDSSRMQGFHVQASYRIYSKKSERTAGIEKVSYYVPAGFYLSPYVSYAELNSYDVQTNLVFVVGGVYYPGGIPVTTPIYGKWIKYNAGMQIGYQFFLIKRITMDFFTGLGYKQKLEYIGDDKNNMEKVVPNKYVPRLLPSWTSHVKTTFGFSIGYSF